MSPMPLTQAKRPVKLAAAFLAGALVVLLAKTALAGPLTSGIPTKFSVYQGVLSIVPTSTGVLELGANGTDIAGNSNLVLRPGTNNSAFVRTDNSGGSDRATQLVLQGQTNQNLKLNLGVHTEASPAYADIGLVEEGVVWRNLVLAKNGGNVSIGGVTSPQAKLVVNNGTGNTGSSGDALAAYANSANAAVYAQQNNNSGWAGYFSGRLYVKSGAIYGLTFGDTGTKTAAGVYVCQRDSTSCLGRYLYTSGTTRDLNMKYCYERESDQTIQCQSVYKSTVVPTCSGGRTLRQRSTTSGISYFSGANCPTEGQGEFMRASDFTTGTAPYGNAGTYGCIDTSTDYPFSGTQLTLRSFSTGGSCSPYNLGGSSVIFRNVSNATTTTVYSQDYELR